MNKCYLKFISLACFLMTASCIQAAVNPADLIKVDKNTDQKCVEYFSYKNAMHCSTTPQESAQPVDPAIKSDEKQIIVFDDRPWQAVWGKKTDTMTMLEYLPIGGDINNWHELVTSQFFPGLQKDATPLEFANLVVKRLKNDSANPIVTFHKKTPDQVIFEFRIKSPESQIQNEIQVISKGKDGLYVLHYAIKVSDMGKKRREMWLNNLSKVEIK